VVVAARAVRLRPHLTGGKESSHQHAQQGCQARCEVMNVLFSFHIEKLVISI
jgi:hypothetical protein